MKCISIEKREKLARRSPLQIYYDIKLNELLQNERNYEWDIEPVSTAGPSQDDYQREVKQATGEDWRQRWMNL